MATPKQVEFIQDLLDQRDLLKSPKVFDMVNAMDEGEYAAWIEAQKRHAETLSVPAASAWIDRLLELPKKRAEASTSYNGAEPEAGMYRLPDGTIVRVYLGQQSGKMLAKQLVDTGRPHPEDPSITLHDYDYMGLATRFLNGAQKLTLEEAKEFGRMSGSCCVCARRLDVPESVEAGIGPVCAKKDYYR